MKELYIAELERIASELEAQGVPASAAYDRAGDLAYDAMRERLADKADEIRKRAKES